MREKLISEARSDIYVTEYKLQRNRKKLEYTARNATAAEVYRLNASVQESLRTYVHRPCHPVLLRYHAHACPPPLPSIVLSLPC